MNPNEYLKQNEEESLTQLKELLKIPSVSAQTKHKEDIQKASVSAEITLLKGGKEITTIIPEKRFYGEGQRQQVTTEIGLRTSLLKDIYVILAGWEEDQTATFSFIIYPLIIWIWIGGFFVFTIGIIITILPRPRKLPKEIEEEA